MSGSLAIDDLDNAVNGVGATVDITSQLGIATGSAITPAVHGGVVGEAGITAGAVALQPGTAGPTGIVWGTVGGTVNVTAGGGATVPSVGVVGTTHVRAVVTTPIAGGKATVVITR